MKWLPLIFGVSYSALVLTKIIRSFTRNRARFSRYERYLVEWKRKNNICVKCGYDLRATPEQCPECGTVPTEGPKGT